MSALEIHSQNPGTGEQDSKNMDTYLDESKLEANQPDSKGGTKSKKLTMLPLMFLIYFAVSGGPFGEEPTVKAAGPLLAIIGFLVFPFIWSIPEALITAELATSFPDNGGYVVWADQAFGPFWGFQMGSLKFLSGVINNAAYPVLCADYMKRLFPILESGMPRTLSITGSTLVLSFFNYMGLTVVGYGAVSLGIISLLPFVLMAFISIPKIQPRRWLTLSEKGTKTDWTLYFNTLFWNLNFWDNASTLAGEVDKPQSTFPKALFSAGILTCLGYLIPLLAATGSLSVNQSVWEDGYLAEAGYLIAGNWLKIWIEIGSVLSSIGLFEAQLSSSSYQLLGMADLGTLPRFFGWRARYFNTPWIGILVCTIVTIGVSCLNFTDIVSSANFLYSFGMILEFASFLWLRKKYPTMNRPYKVPLGIPALTIMCLIPTGFIIYVCCIATKMVYLISGSLIILGVVLYWLMTVIKSKGWMEFTKKNDDTEVEQEAK